MTIKISSILVTYNESKRLAECLNSYSFCDEIIVYDMGSTDSSVEIAQKFASEVRIIPRVDYVEKIWKRIISEAKNDWVILLDPDEIFPTAVSTYIEYIINTQPKVALISIPWKYYFLEEPLNSTNWGRNHFKARVFNKNNIEISGIMFDGIKTKPSYLSYTIPYELGFIIRHYWIDSIPQLFSKHWRYIRNDGETRFKKGERFDGKRLIKDMIKSLSNDLFKYQGINDGWRGIFLSVFHTWFIFSCHISLCHYQYFVIPNTRNEHSS